MGADREPRVLSRRTGRIAWFVGSTIVVALVIAIGAAFSTPKTSPQRDPVTRTSANDGGERDYRSALAALASGETTEALDLLRSAASAGNAAAKSKLDELTKKPAESTPGTPTAPSDDELSRPVADVAALLPVAVPGYSVSSAEMSPLGAILSLQPTYEGPYGKVTIVVMSVLDKGSEAGARAYVEQLPRAFPQSGQTVTIGSRSGRFGTDGSRLAAVAFSRGRYAFEVVATAARPDPTKIKDIALAVAAAFPAAR